MLDIKYDNMKKLKTKEHTRKIHDIINLFFFKLFRLSICDCKTGFCMFDLVWNENYVVIPSSLGSLISSFYQIGREFGDKGGIQTFSPSLLYF